MSLSISQATFSEFAFPLEGQVTGKITFRDSKIWEVVDVSSANDLSALRRIIGIWKGIARERFAYSEAYHEQNKTDASKTRKEEDAKVIEGFEITLMLLDEVFKSHTEKNKQEVIKVLKDDNNNIQGICSAQQCYKDWYLNEIVTAPWNLKMYGPVQKPHESLRIKGAGTILVSYIYEEGYRRGQRRLILDPTGNSFSYYTNHLKMFYDGRTGCFSYPISATGEFPDPLQSALTRIFPSTRISILPKTTHEGSD